MPVLSRFATTMIHTKSPVSPCERGSFLLEALIAILIVALGVLGSVGLLARSMQDIDDAKYRGEAAFLANQLIGQMWVSDRITANLDANFSSVPGTAPGYLDFKSFVQQRLPNANQYVQDVTVAPGPNAPAVLTNSLVTITIRWIPPGEWKGAPAPLPPAHKYSVTASIGANQ
jgi:type IV pilus assembly protein PilV